MKAAVPLYYGKVEGEIIYHRTTFVPEMSCEQLSSHLYRRMCCAGRSKRSAVVGGKASGRGSWATAGKTTNFFHSLSRNILASRVKTVGVDDDIAVTFLFKLFKTLGNV